MSLHAMLIKATPQAPDEILVRKPIWTTWARYGFGFLEKQSVAVPTDGKRRTDFALKTLFES